MTAFTLAFFLPLQRFLRLQQQTLLVVAASHVLLVHAIFWHFLELDGGLEVGSAADLVRSGII